MLNAAVRRSSACSALLVLGSCAIDDRAPTVAEVSSGAPAPTGEGSDGASAARGDDGFGATGEASAEGSRSEPAELAAPQLALETTAIDFGRVVVGQAAPTVLIVRNGGSAPLLGLETAIVGSAAGEFTATVDASCATLAPGSSCGVNVRFAPAQPSLRSASLLVSSAGETLEVALTGLGAMPGVLAADAGGFDFGGQEVGVGSTPFTWVITNAGTVATGPLRRSGLDGPEFAVANDTCVGSLAPGASCRLVITYLPGVASVHRAMIGVGDGQNEVAAVLVGRGQYRLTVVRAGAGQGVVVGPAGAIDCGASCSALFDPGSVQLTAYTTNGSNAFFSGYRGPTGTCEGPSRFCTVNMERSLTVTATFSVQTNNLIFRTSEVYSPSLGAAGYDRECNVLAGRAGINNATNNGFIAALSGTTALAERIPAGVRGWVRMDGLPVLDQRAALGEDPPNVHYSVQFDENGELHEDGDIWTGSGPSGELAANCSAWTTTAGTVQAALGSARVSPFWLNDGAVPCDSAPRFESGGLAVACMGITKSAPITLPSFSGKRMWITNTAYTPGSVAPDEKCQAERPSGIAAARAYLGYLGRPAEGTLDLTATYVRLDGQLIGTGAQITAGTARSAPRFAADGSVYRGFVWTGNSGAPRRALPPRERDTCGGDWSSSTGTGTFGNSGYDNERGFHSGEVECSLANVRLYCVEL